MALNFPSNPINGQTYGSYTYDATVGIWRSSSAGQGIVSTTTSAPTTAVSGDMWFNPNDGTMYVYYNDGTSSQWIESRAPITADGYQSPNYVINGAFDINQRVLTSTTTDGYGLDRWFFQRVPTAGSVTHSVQSFVASEAPNTQIQGKNYARIVCSGQASSADYAAIRTDIEGVRSLAGQVVTLSFYARSGSGTPQVGVSFAQGFGTGGSVSTLQSNIISLSGGTSWTRYSVTTTIPSISGKTIIEGQDFLRVWLFTSCGSSVSAVGYPAIGPLNGTVDVWGFQLEQGSVATPFRRNANSIQGELAACQRYYYRKTVEAIYGHLGDGWGDTTTLIIAKVSIPVTMRTTPASLEWSGTGANYVLLGTGSANVSNIGLYTSLTNSTSIGLAITATGAVAGRPYFLTGNNSTAGYLAVSAEL